MNYYLMRETTDYGDKIPGGVYLFASKPTTRVAKAYGFISHVTDECKLFVKPLDIDMKARTFVRVGVAT